MLQYLPSIRLTSLLLFLFAVAAMASMYYMQFVMDLVPCPLCITQRIFMIALGLVALVAAIHNPKAVGRRIYAGLGLLFTAGGWFFAFRHVGLQNLPEDQVPVCGPSLEYLLENFPLMQALEVLLRGDGNCAEVVWEFGLTIPGWSLVGFSGLIIVHGWQLLRRQ